MNKKGIIYMLIAAFAFAWMNLMAKYLQDFHPMQVVFFRAFGTFVFIFPYMIVKKIPIIGKNYRWLSVRGVLSFVSLALFFTVVQRIPLGSAVALRYTAPIFSVVLAYFFLKEKVKFWQWISLIIAVVGAFIMKGLDLRIDTYSFILIMLSALLVGAVFVIVRYLGNKEHFLTIINYFMVFSIVGSLFFLNHWRMPLGDEWIWIGLIGTLGLVGQVFFTKSFQMAETSLVAPLKYMELVYALIFGYVLFGETYSVWSIFGMILVVVGMLLNIAAKRH
ncbi:DMT family transporter [Winogradskyella tangerina]|uniref:DMT family transporter n=1 Tax=Winogradskyella tangerina TaxID=2023240 RepID=UPI0021D21367|nr:DMT family transporter [Winogradskyella tangerina]